MLPPASEGSRIDDGTCLNVAHAVWSCRVLGPGNRAVVWVRGCPLRCRGCLADPILNDEPRTMVRIRALAARVLEHPNLDGITFSGGEPMAQAGALADLCGALRRVRDLSIMSYSGYTLEHLRARRDPDVMRLLGALDILVDGPFQPGLQADLLWRGSSNQRIHLLTNRHRDLAGRLDGPSAGVEVVVRQDGSVFWSGVPSPGFAEHLAARLGRHGIDLVEAGGIWS